MEPSLTPFELFMQLLPFAVLAWAFTGRGVIARGRIQVMLYVAFACALHSFGLRWFICWFAVITGVFYWSVRRHRLRARPIFQAAPVQLRDFRGDRDLVAEQADRLGFEHALDFHQDLRTASFDCKLFTDGAGTYLWFSRTQVTRSHGDHVWMYSHFADGTTLISTDDLRLIDFHLPFRLYQMKRLDSLEALYALHKAGLARHAAKRPLVLEPNALLERIVFDETNRLAGGHAAGYLERTGDDYRFTFRMFARTALDSLSLRRPLAEELTLGGLDPSTLPTRPV